MLRVVIVSIGQSGSWAREYMRHSDNKEGEEEGRGEEGGCGSGSGVEVGGHSRGRS